MTEDLKKQTIWFAKKIIEIRHRTDGFYSPTVFDLGLINAGGIVEFSVEKTPLGHVKRMFGEIRGEIIKIHPSYMSEIFIKEEGGNVEINGLTSDFIREFLRKKYLKESFSLFGEKIREDGKTVLTYLGKNSEETIIGKELAVFRCLLKKKGEVALFSEFYEAFNSIERLIHSTPPTKAKQKESVQSAKNSLESKLKKATGFDDYPEIIVNVRGDGYKMNI